uniref:Ig-like domain-containing protein n=1 Tax=Chelonoidis abingdonii TaxID=106734 RepID=A0A8C0IZ14_CHEAB
FAVRVSRGTAPYGGAERVCLINCNHTCQILGASSTQVDGIRLTDLRVLPPLAPGPPERVVLEPLPEMELGRAYNLTCWVLNVAPVAHLTMTIRRGAQTLHTETFQNHTRIGPNNIPVTHEITPQRRDHGQEITCHAALDLTPHGSHTLHVPDTPLCAPETHSMATARCGVAGVFPTVGEARFTLSFGGESLNFTVTTSGDTATAQGEVWSLFPGQRELKCTVTVGPVSRSAGQSVLVYSECLGGSRPHPEQGLDAKRVLVPSAPAQPPVQFQLTAGEEDDGREFTCEARPHSGIPAVKHTSARLTVFYGPRMDDSGCPREWIWKEGTEQSFSCLARGNPAPAVECMKDGVSVSIGVQRQVRREDAGTYRCKASNAHGSASREVTVQVECKWLLVDPPAAVRERLLPLSWASQCQLSLPLSDERQPSRAEVQSRQDRT